MTEEQTAAIAEVDPKIVEVMDFLCYDVDQDTIVFVPASSVTLDDKLFGFSIGSIAKAQHNGESARRFSLMAPESNGQLEVGRLILLEQQEVPVVRYNEFENPDYSKLPWNEADKAVEGDEGDEGGPSPVLVQF